MSTKEVNSGAADSFGGFFCTLSLSPALATIAFARLPASELPMSGSGRVFGSSLAVSWM